ncbi:MAG TPA: PEGA domain-containing protein [Polyangia bacterium]|jgi:TolB-like protein
MRRYCATTLLLSAVLLTAGAAHAQTSPPSLAVLGVEPVDVPEALAQQLTDALRQRAAATSGIHAVAGKDLIEIKGVFGCDTESPTCMAQAGKTLGADKLLYGTIKKSGRNVVVGLKLLDVRSAGVERAISETVSKRELAAGSVNNTAARLFAKLVPVEAKPTVTITSDPSNAAVAVDGQAMGRTPVTLRDLSPGSHTVAISLRGHETAMRTIELRPGASHELAVTLEAVQPPPIAVVPPTEPTTPATPPPVAIAPRPGEGPSPSHPGRTAKYIALGSLIGGVAAGAVAIYTWRTYSDLSSSAHQQLMLVQSENPKADQSFFHKPTCTPPAGLTGSPALNQYKQDCSSGEGYAAATTALWVVAGALATGSVVAYVIGDRQAAKARETKSTARLIRETLRVEPVISTVGGGLRASFEF